MHSNRRTFWMAIVLALSSWPALAQSVGPAGDWNAYGHDAAGTRYSALRGITRENVRELKVAWIYHTGETAARYATHRTTGLEATPLLVAGTLYLDTPLGRVIALDPVTGTERWSYDPEVDRDGNYGDFTSRGVSAWTDPRAGAGACARRIFVATIDARLIALDGKTGRPCTEFGRGGTVNLRDGLRNAPSYQGEYEETSPPAIIGGLVIVGSAVADNSRIAAASGEVRAYDARTGALRWTWDPIPQDSTDAGWRTWIGPRAHHTGAANAWSVIAADSARDLVFIPTGSASVDYFGGERLGQNLYANSIVALRASTGQMVWHFQTVHHDLWDYDNASPPALVTIARDGRRIDAVLQATKTGQLYVLDRATGAPIFPVIERPVPRSTIEGEEAWPTQPFNSTLPALSPQNYSAADAWGVDADELEACRKRIAGLRNEGSYTPPSIEGSLVAPSNIGGAHWGGVAFDPERGIVVIPVNTIAAEVQLIPRQEYERRGKWAADPEWIRKTSEYTDMEGTPFVMRRSMILSPKGLPCTPPPFGKLVALDLSSGTRLWETPLGSPSSLIADSAARRAARSWGSPNLGGPIVTAGGLVFVAGTLDNAMHAFDVETGRELWSGSLPASGKATPMTYQVSAGGKQYVVIAAGGDGKVFGKSDAIVAFSR
ncbi:MAG: pyrroloquinoline quinone-dependent dehydrogenase [Gemmatimonadota bacterium]